MTTRVRAKASLLAVGALLLTVVCPLSIANGGYQMLQAAPSLPVLFQPLYIGLATSYLAVSPLAFLVFGYYCIYYTRQICVK